jgi:hypothetical protein
LPNRAGGGALKKITRWGHAMKNAKEQIKGLLADLPDTCTLEDIQYHLYVIAKIRGGIQAAEQQETLAQEDVERRLALWLSR